MDVPTKNASAETVTCACCLRAIVLGKALAPKRHGWSVQGHRTVGQYHASWHTGPCQGVSFPHLRESRAGADHMLKLIALTIEKLSGDLHRVERRETPLHYTTNIASQLWNAHLGIKSTRGRCREAAAHNASLIALAAVWIDASLPMDVSCLGIRAEQRKHYDDNYVATFSVAPGWAGDGTDRAFHSATEIRLSHAICFNVPTYEKLRANEIARLTSAIEQLNDDTRRFREALTAHGW